jgi:hypothetical protein
MNFWRRSSAVLMAIAAAALLATPTHVLAQSDTGGVDGRVFDESRAAVPGATITARNMNTGLSRTTASSASGTFRLGSLPPGTYEITAELQGFAKQTRRVEIQVASTATVDFTMTVSPQTELVTVVGEAPLVQATTSDVGQVITSRLVENIPLNGRKFQDLSLLVPGTRPSNYYDPTKTEVGGISYGGATGRNVIINVDGGDNNDGVVRGLLQQFSAEAIQEYKVTTQRYSAEYGRSTGGVVNVITKSGTNEVRGSVFYQWRDDSLNSKTFFEKEQNLDKNPFKQQQFGATLGGPITRDKAHYFVSYERNVRDEFAIVDTGGAVPAEEGAFPQPFRNNLLTAKLNFRLGPDNNVTARYSLEDQKTENDFIGGNTLASSGALNTNKIHSAVVKNTTTFGSNKLNEFLVLFQHFENNITANDNSIPGIQTPGFFFGANLNTPQQTIQRRWQVKDDFSFRKEGWGGDHDFKVGGELIRSHYGGFFVPTLYGYFIFNSELPSRDAYLNAIADTFSGSAGDNEFDDNWTYVAGYIQDDWKPNNKLTINLGLRYELQTGPFSNEFDTASLRALAAVGANTQRSQDKNNFGPRVGFAYDVNGDATFVVRGGYGRYYDEIFSNITLYEYWSQVNSPTFFISEAPASFTPNQYRANRDAIRASFIDPSFAGQLLRLTAPDLVQPSNDQINVGFSKRVGRDAAVDVDYVFSKGNDDIHRWRINTAQNVNTRISPAGRFAPSLGAILVEGNRGRSRFQGLYVAGKVRKERLYLLGTYALTYAKNISDGFNTQPADITNANWEFDYGWAPNDVRHRATLAGIYQFGGGFQLSTSAQFNTGKPHNALAGLGGLSNAVRAIDPATGRQFERNAFRADNFFTWDARLSKSFRFAKSRELEIFAQVFNITDHVNYDRDSYVTRFTSSNFGQPTEILPNSQRQAEFGARLRF